MSSFLCEQMKDKLTGALIGLARATDGNEHLISQSSTAVVIESLLAARSNENSDPAALKTLLNRVYDEKKKMVPDCFVCASPCGKNNNYDMQKLWAAEENVRSLKCQLLAGIREMAAKAHHATVPGGLDKTVELFFYKALVVIGIDEFEIEDLRPIVAEMEEVSLKCIALIDM